MPRRYAPTPVQIERDSRAVIDVVRVALANLDLRHVPPANEETTAGSCYVEPTAKAK